MRLLLRNVVVASAMAGAFYPVFAEPLSLNTALRIVLNSHPLINQRTGAIGAAEDDIRAAKWKIFPTLTVDSARNVSNETPPGYTHYDRNAGTYRVQQPIWTGGRVSTEVDGAESRHQAAQFSLMETEQDLLLKTVQSFGDFLRMKERVKIAESNVREHERLVDMITRRQQQEVSSRADVSLAKARLQQARTELSSMRSAMLNARSTLEQLIGEPLPPDELESLDGIKWSWEGLNQVANEALAYSPTLQRMNAELEASRADAENRKAQLLPQLVVRYEKFAGSAAILPYDRWMVALEYQPGSGLSSVAGMEAAAKRVGMAQDAYVAGTRDLKDRAASWFNDAESLRAQAEAANEYADATVEVMASYLRQYTIGRKSWLEVMNAQREMAQAQYSAIDTKIGAAQAARKLDLLTGRLSRAKVFSSEEPLLAGSNVVVPASTAPTQRAVEAKAEAKELTEKTEVPQIQEQAISQFVESWVSAWQRQDADAYLGFYAENFQTGSRSRSDWEKWRRARLSNKSGIHIALDSVVVEELSLTKAKVQFWQDYRSDRFNSKSQKTLLLEDVGGGWKIVSETEGQIR